MPNSAEDIITAQNEPEHTFSNKPELKFRKTKIFAGSPSEMENPRRMGIVMHAVLGKMQRKSEQVKAIEQCIGEGIFSLAQKPEVLHELDKFWSMPETAEWFADDAQVLNETTILTLSGDMYRPDRVVLNDKNAVVVDYKFGEYEKYTYERQVKDYMNLLKEMEYNAKGFIYYVNLGKVAEVV